MKSFSAHDAANSPYSHGIHPVLTSVADEVCATVARLFAYVGVLALFGILGLQAWDKLQADLAAGSGPATGWSIPDSSSPAIAPSLQGPSNKADRSNNYVSFRHSSEGRKDVPRRFSQTDTPLADWMSARDNPPLRGAL